MFSLERLLMLLVEVADAPGCRNLLFDGKESSLYTPRKPVQCKACAVHDPFVVNQWRRREKAWEQGYPTGTYTQHPLAHCAAARG